jgi:hypothetical protein
MHVQSRRTFTNCLLGSLFTVSLAQTVCRADAFTGKVRPVARKWLSELQAASADLRAQSITQLEWQQQVESCLSAVDRADLLAAIDYEHLAEGVDFGEDHESAVPVHLVNQSDSTTKLSFSPWFFAMKKHVSVVPHGHHNMTTRHMILKGEVHGRHFDRVHDEPGFLTIRPTSDKVLRAGAVSTISDESNNIHWFTALTGPVFMFNMQVVGLDAAAAVGGRDYVDPSNGAKLAGGLIRARRLEKSEAYKLYGHI